jgi:hypothetical protein
VIGVTLLRFFHLRASLLWITEVPRMAIGKWRQMASGKWQQMAISNSKCKAKNQKPKTKNQKPKAESRKPKAKNQPQLLKSATRSAYNDCECLLQKSGGLCHGFSPWPV